MKISSIDKGIALSFKELMSELRPEIVVEIFEEDYELLKLGMAEEDASCTVEVDITDEQVDSLCEEIVKLQESSLGDIEKMPDYNSEDYKKYERYRWLPSMFI